MKTTQSLILLSSLLIGAEVHGAIVHMTIPEEEQFFAALGEGRNRGFDFDFDGRDDLVFTGSAQGFVVSLPHSRTGVSTANMTGLNFAGKSAVPFQKGEIIERYTEDFSLIPFARGINPGPNKAYLLSFGVLDAFVGGVWYEQEAYMGFAISNPEPELPFTDFYYGWIRIKEFGGAGGFFYEWALKTEPNVPIRAGQIPEPSQGLLLLLAGVGGILRRQRC